MAKFQAKKLNENEINSGNKWEYGQSPSVEAFNEPVEAILYAQEKLEEHQKDFEQIYAILGDTVTDKISLSQAYKSRETANGNQDIIDGQYTPVTLIEGDTVNSVNEFDISKVPNTDAITNNGDGTLTIKGGVYAASVNSQGGILGSLLCPNLKAGDEVTINAKSTAPFKIFWWGEVRQFGSSFKVTQEMLTTGAKSMTFYGNRDSTEPAIISEIQIEKGTEVTPYVPYFDGLKHAHFKAIKSTGRNLINRDEIISFTTLYETKKQYFQAGDYTISCKSYTQGGDSSPVIVLEHESGTSYSLVCSEGSKTHTLIEGNYTIKYFSNGLNFNNSQGVTSSVTGLMIQHGTTATGYEPYTENLFELSEAKELPAFVSINPQTGELTNANHRIVLTGDEALWTESTTAISGKYRWALLYNHNNYPLGVGGYGIASGGYDTVTGDDTWSNKKGVHFNGPEFAFYDPDFADSRDAWRNHLRALYQAGTPIVVEIKVETPTITKLENIPKSYKAYKGGSETVEQGETDNSEYGAMPTITQEYYTQKGS